MAVLEQPRSTPGNKAMILIENNLKFKASRKKQLIFYEN